MRRLAAALAVLAALALPGRASEPGLFDHYVLALSWMPGFCALTGTERGDAACAEGGRGFALHGLWPQHAAGDWPEFCDSPHPGPTRAETAAAGLLYGSPGLAAHQWRKHGSCSGLAPGAYFRLAARAVGAVRLPQTLGFRGDRLRGAEVTRAVLALNPGLPAEAVVVTCARGRLHEVRICLSRDLAPRACAPQLRARDCAERLLSVAPDPPGR